MDVEHMVITPTRGGTGQRRLSGMWALPPRGIRFTIPASKVAQRRMDHFHERSGATRGSAFKTGQTFWRKALIL